MRAAVFCFTSLVPAVALTGALCGCTVLHGGRLISGSEDGYPVLSEYRALDGPTHSIIRLVGTGGGPALLVRDSASKPALCIPQAWEDVEGRHFVIWRESRIWWPGLLGAEMNGLEFVIPADPSRPGKVVGYPAGGYSIVEADGIQRPVRSGVDQPPLSVLLPLQESPEKQ